jgi:hypothetical protein
MTPLIHCSRLLTRCLNDLRSSTGQLRKISPRTHRVTTDTILPAYQKHWFIVRDFR